jgi:hypothetical protein
MADETDLDRSGRTAIIADIGVICGREGDNVLRKTRAQECLHTGKPAGLLFDPHAERDLPLGEQRGQPATRIAPVQQQQIARREAVKLLKEHLPFAFTWAVKGRRQHEIGARLMAGSEPQADGRGIGSEQSQSVPSPDVTAGVGLADEPVVEGRDRGSCQFDAGLGEGLLGDLPRQLSLVLQVRKELVQLGLNNLAQWRPRMPDPHCRLCSNSVLPSPKLMTC